MDDIFSDSMNRLIQLFNIKIDKETDFQESDLFRFSYTDEEMDNALLEGIESNYDDFVGEDGFCSFDNRTVLVYIKHQTSMTNTRKFHFTSCPIVTQNISKDVYDTKFVMTTRRDGFFKVFNPHGKEQEIRLEPCGHCCKTAKIELPLSVELIYQRLENNSNKKKVSKRPKNSHNVSVSKQFTDGYVWNWKGISRIIRARRNFTCEVCRVNLQSSKHLLHVHHKNRDKKDNTEDNLHVLCVECHSDQRDHEHMKTRFVSEINQIRNLRTKLTGIV